MTLELRKVPGPFDPIKEWLIFHQVVPRGKVCQRGAQQADHPGEDSYPARGGSIVQLAVHARESRRQGQRGHRVITQQLRGGAKRDVL